MFTRTRYQYGSLEVKERKKGKEVWEFRYYETDAEGKRQRRAAIVASREEYPTESAARKSPAVQAILLRLNAEQPSASGAVEFGRRAALTYSQRNARIGSTFNALRAGR